MDKIIKTKNFIDKCLVLHNNKYSYEKTEYLRNDVKVNITCPMHGEFWQMPYSHLRGAGCEKCGIKKSKQTRTYSNETFIEKANNVHNFKFDYSKLEYTNSTSKIIVICKKHGEFYPTANNHLQGSNCPKCRYENNVKFLGIKEEKFKEKIKNKNLNEKFLFLSDYVNYSQPIKIQCKKCKHIFHKPPKHIAKNGSCPKCSGYYKNNKELIEKFNKIHNFKYDYSEFNYINSSTKVKIICPLHGGFWQLPYNHLNKKNCPKCGIIETTEKNKFNSIGWVYEKWEKAGNKSKHFDGFKVYIIKCWNENEKFYKIGKTFTTVEKRFCYSMLPYKWEKIKIFTGSSKEMSILENKLKSQNKEYSYVPNLKFAGSKECFYKIIDL